MLTIYSQENCAPCLMAKKYFDHFGKEYVVKEREEYADEMIGIAGTVSTPVVTDGRNVVIGYNPKELSEML